MCVPGLFLSYQPLDTPDPYFPRRDGGNVIWEPTVRAYLHNFTFVAFFDDNTVLNTMASYDVFRQGKKSVYSKRHLTWRQYRNIVDSKTLEKHAFTHLFIYSFSSYTAKVQLCYSHILHRNITNSRFQGHVSQNRCSRLFVDVDTFINYLNILAKRGIRTSIQVICTALQKMRPN